MMVLKRSSICQSSMHSAMLPMKRVWPRRVLLPGMLVHLQTLCSVHVHLLCVNQRSFCWTLQ